MEAGADGLPTTPPKFFAKALNPVDLQVGPDGNLFYPNLEGGTIRRVRYSLGNNAPVAIATADPRSGAVPLTVTFDATESTDVEGDDLTYAWDLDDDGEFDDSTVSRPSKTFGSAGDYSVRVRVTDAFGANSVAAVTVNAGNQPPNAVIETPSAATTWRVGERIAFSGRADDPDQGSLGAAALSWSIVLHHCPFSCHQHPVETIAGVSQGEWVAPAHEYPSHLELRLTATDEWGLSDTTSVTLHPATVVLSLRSQPSGLVLSAGAATRATPYDRTFIEGSTLTVSAPSPQTINGTTYEFVSWSDGGAPTHDVTATSAATLVATYQAVAT
jgi:PKD repeat protein